MRSNKGMTVLELILGFSLATIVIIYLFQIIALVQSLYIDNDEKTNYLIKQNNLINHIYKDLEEKVLIGTTACSSRNNCYTMTYSDGTAKEISLYEENGNTYIKYGKYVVNYGNKLKGNSLTITKEEFVESDGVEKGNIYDAILRIYAPIDAKDGLYDINVVYQYSTLFNNVDVR